MIEIPASVILSTTLEVGCVYYFISDNVSNTREPHYNVVVYCDEEKVLCVTATSKVAGRIYAASKFREPRGVIVLADETNEAFLKKPSAFDCGSAHLSTKKEIEETGRRHEIIIKGKASENLVIELIAGIKLSRRITGEIKRLFDNE